jgi:hypothetical protein
MTRRLLQACSCLFALGLLLILPVASHAQAVYGSITGTVTDPTGAAIPNATITVTDEEKGTSVSATSNGSGEFTIEHMIVDKYDLKIDAAGFKGYEAKGIQVYVDTSAKVTAQLQVGTTSQTVEVSADAIPVLKTDRADVSTVFTQKEVQDLPIGGRNFTGLQLLLPGAQLLGWSHAADENPQGSQQIQVDGQAFGGVAYELDGTDNQDPILGIIVINPPLDALSEAKITTQNFDAEFGKAVSAVIVASTKSGTNSFHGSAFDYRTSTANQAIDPWTQAGATSIPSGLKNQFGGSVGGPILKDRLFFFGDYQGVRQKVAESAQDTIPSLQVFQTCVLGMTGPNGPGCDFSQYSNFFGANGTIYDSTGTAYPNNVIPTAQLSAPTVQFLTDMYNFINTSTPNPAGQKFESSDLATALSGSNFQGSGTGLFNNNQWDVRIDGQVTDKAHAFGRFSRFTDVLSGAQMFGSNVGGPGYGLSNYGGVSQGANDSAAAGMDFLLSPKWLTDFRLGYYRYNIIDQKNNAGTDYFTQLGIPGENVGGLTSGSGGFSLNSQPNGGAQPQYGSFLSVNRCNCPLEEREDQFQLVNNWTRILGNHSIKFGADIRYARNLRVPSDTDRTGINSFATGPTSNSTGTSGGLSYATFLLGDVSSYGRYVSVSTNAKEFQKRDFFYAQDTWRITPNLTLNYGLRYELFFPEAVNGKGNGALMNLNTGYLSVAGYGNIGTNMNWSPDKVALSPRVGVAYQLNPKTVIRAGYGRSYDIGVFGSIFGHNVTQNLPVLANQEDSATCPRCSVFGLTTGPQAYPFPAVPANGLLPAPGYAVSPKARPDPLRLPLLDAWNFSIQRSITPTLSVTAAYIGNKGTHTLADGDGNNTNPNEAGIFLPVQDSIVPGLALHYDPTVHNISTGGISGIAANGGTTNNTYLSRYYGGTLPACQDSAYSTPTNETGIVPGMCGWTNGISFYHDALDTHFNALQVTVAKQLQHGMSLTANYQWARAFDYNSGYATWDKTLAYGRDSAVREQQLVGYGIWQLPFGRGAWIDPNANRIVDEIIGHWQISGTVNWAGGLPFTLSEGECGLSVPGSAPCYANSPSGQRVGLHYHKTAPNSATYFTPLTSPLASQSCASGTAPVCPITYNPQGGFTQPGIDQVGNVGRNNYFGPNYINTDMAIQKNFPIHEEILAQFRMDVFNFFNHDNPGLPGGSIDSGGGTITGEALPQVTTPVTRYLQFSLRVQF